MYEILEEIYISLNRFFIDSLNSSKNIKLEAELYKKKDLLIIELENNIKKYDKIIEELKNEI